MKILQLNKYFYQKGGAETVFFNTISTLENRGHQAPSEVGIIYNRVIREVDSLSSNSFCIYAIDTKEKKIYITFFGAYKPTDKAEYPLIY